MKHLNNYIVEHQIKHLNEGILDKLTNWFKNLFKNQETLKDKTIKVDTKNIKGPDKSIELKELIKNSEELKLINDKSVGFPVSAMLIKQKNQYLTKEDKDGNKQEYETLVDRYFYVDGDNKYDIGIIMYDEKIKNDNNYVNLINLEVIQRIDNISEVQKYIGNIFEDNMKKKGFTGAQYDSKHPRVKAILIKLGYQSENNNKDILFKNFK